MTADHRRFPHSVQVITETGAVIRAGIANNSDELQAIRNAAERAGFQTQTAPVDPAIKLVNWLDGLYPD